MTDDLERRLRQTIDDLHRIRWLEDTANVKDALRKIARLRAENDHLAEVLARIAYEGLDDPARAAHDALKATARPLQDGSRHE